MLDRLALTLAESDPGITAAVGREVSRQHEGLEMIASVNFVSRAVQEAVGSVSPNKYAEGCGGCEYPDVTQRSGRAGHSNPQRGAGQIYGILFAGTAKLWVPRISLSEGIGARFRGNCPMRKKYFL